MGGTADGAADTAPVPSVIEAFRGDPDPYYQALRETSPIRWDPIWRGWIVTRYEDVLDCLRDDRLSASRSINVGDGDAAMATQMQEMFTKWLVFTDPPLHTRLRSALKPPFAPRRMASLAPHVVEYVDALIERIDTSTEIDFVARFAKPLPATVISHVLGVPDEDMDQFTAWADDVAAVAHSGTRGERIFDSYREITAYLERLLREPDAQRPDGLLSQLTRESDLNESEVVASGVMLLVGGIDTTRNQLGNTMIAISRAPGLWEALRRDSSRIPDVIEEAVRYEGASRATVRLVTTSHQRYDVTWNVGDKVMLVINSANSDSTRFDDPRTVDADRPDNRHLGFGYGRHFCIGAPLARLELRIALEQLTARFGGMTISSSELDWEDKLLTRGVKQLMVRFAEGEGAR